MYNSDYQLMGGSFCSVRQYRLENKCSEKKWTIVPSRFFLENDF